jgi:hypothetical protein
MDKKELKILGALDTIVRRESACAAIDQIAWRVERKLTQDSATLLAWEPVPLATYGKRLPYVIQSSWVFVLRAQANTGAERHPNSRQRMISYTGSGDLQIWDGERWCSHHLVSNANAPIESRWLSIPPNVWHQAVIPVENWVVVSFHTVLVDELIEERPDAIDAGLTHRRKYMEELKS